MTRRKTRSSSTRARSSSASRTPEAQLTRSFNRLVAEKPVWAAIALVGLILIAWFLMREPSDNQGSPAPPSSVSVAATTTVPPSTTPTPKATSAAPTQAEVDPASGLPYIAESALPDKAKEVLAAIRAGGPYEFDEDGAHFGNYEGLLPKEKSSYYSEYTVQMPGDRTRGAHRFVVGDGGEIYWTDDHYESFSVVREGA